MRVKAKLSYICEGTQCTAFVTFCVADADDVADHLEALFGLAVMSEDVVIEWVTSKPEEVS